MENDNRNHDLSVVIICRNADRSIEQVLAPLAPCDEVILADTGSTDLTLEIAKRFENVRVHKIPFRGFGPTKNFAIDLAKNDWILSLDADEIVSPNFIDQCLDFIAENKTKSLGRCLRKNLFMGYHVRHSGWGNDYLIRLFNRLHTRFKMVQVHESVEQKNDSKIITLSEPISHLAVIDPEDLIQKSILYDSLRTPTSISNPSILMVIAFVKSFARFIKIYVIQLGLLDGIYGLLIAISGAQNVFWRYAKQALAKG